MKIVKQVAIGLLIGDSLAWAILGAKYSTLATVSKLLAATSVHYIFWLATR